MNFNEVLASSVEAVYESERPELHPVAYERIEGYSPATLRKDALSHYCELPSAYEHLAWAFIGTAYDTFREMSPQAMKERHISLLESSQTGIVVMARYLSILPAVYATYRKDFPNVPEDISAQAQELGTIAGRSNGFISAIAHETNAVSGDIERRQHLRGPLIDGPLARKATSAWDFILKSSDNGLEIAERFNIHGQIKAVNRRFEQAVGEGRTPTQRKVGCMALKIELEGSQSLFEGIWQAMVRYAATNDELFKKSLNDLYSELKAYSIS